jgi:hypothetical protein
MSAANWRPIGVCGGFAWYAASKVSTRSHQLRFDSWATWFAYQMLIAATAITLTNTTARAYNTDRFTGWYMAHPRLKARMRRRVRTRPMLTVAMIRR